MPIGASLLRHALMLHHDAVRTASKLEARGGATLDVSPLPDGYRDGTIMVVTASLVSAVAVLGLLGFLTYRLMFSHKRDGTYLGHNQFVVLIYNLLLADLHVALGFIMSAHWIQNDGIFASSPICFAQGWLLQLGDPSSGLFVVAIAVHTFATVFAGRKLSYRLTVSCIIGLWCFCLLLVIVPTARHGRHTYVPSGAWCWINQEFEAERFWLHYLWIFFSEFGSLLLYTILFFYLRRKMKASADLARGQKEKFGRLSRVTSYMVLYPLAYLVLSLPIAAARMASVQGNPPSLTYLCVAAAIIASSGTVDVIVYALTRKALLLDSELSRTSEKGGSGSNGRRSQLASTTDHRQSQGYELNKLNKHNAKNPASFGDHSTDDIIDQLEKGGFGKVYQQTTIEITHEPAEYDNGPPSSSTSIDQSMVARGPSPQPGQPWGGEWK
ncbi:integral membrane protein [Nannizzia gypsea CBS 118893]|uniref:Integral membrane protein n=1 Tax=Arthroderma gypseum (strain ATCC MYA-4604 / CBS 118893) TaxID=535722 RepID=E4UNI8_ARTGP|nr:integral membrane protein [Nannizzia gypsea CBS 118893]EFQ99596.1 integral membrane protein [Nannizzia gypsea CBS 118893]